MTVINVGLIGLGTVGTGLVRIFHENGGLVENKLGFSLRLKRIAVKDISKAREIPLGKSVLTDKARDILDDPNIDIVVELVGGENPAKEFIISALNKGKSVVTANKLILAKHGKEIFEIADKNAVDIGFEASVAGTIPIVRALEEGLAANKIEKIVAIVNGTTNYILTRMTETFKTFDEALKEAQEMGFAEADPSMDIKGNDSAYKLAILSMLAFGMKILPEDVFTEGITGVTPEHIERANSFGYVIKLIAVAESFNGKVSCRVHPVFLGNKHPLAAVQNEFNAIYVVGNAAGETMYYGRGAGQMPTASAVMSDVIELAERHFRDCKKKDCPSRVMETKTRSLFWCDKSVLPADEVFNKYYLCFPIVDQPGVIGKITTILGVHGISISAVKATIVDKSKNRGLVEIFTHSVREGTVKKALAEITGLSMLTESVFFYRIME